LKDYQEEHRNKAIRIRSFMDMLMGSLFVLIGIYFLIYDLVKINVFGRDPWPIIDQIIGVVFLLYGFWRIRRGYKKDYYR
jgi:hypothetical protein